MSRPAYVGCGLLLGWLAILIVLIGALLLHADPAHCAYCPQYPCWATSACGGECVCLQEQSWKAGRCVYLSPYAVGR